MREQFQCKRDRGGCGQWLLAEAFPKDKSYVGGRGTVICSMCRARKRAQAKAEKRAQMAVPKEVAEEMRLGAIHAECNQAFNGWRYPNDYATPGQLVPAIGWRVAA